MQERSVRTERRRFQPDAVVGRAERAFGRVQRHVQVVRAGGWDPVAEVRAVRALQRVGGLARDVDRELLAVRRLAVLHVRLQDEHFAPLRRLAQRRAHAAEGMLHDGVDRATVLAGVLARLHMQRAAKRVVGKLFA
jgi:hypothetical protein